MVKSSISRWGTRFASCGITLALAFPLVFSEVEPTEAQSPVCFTAWGKCFCVDFFLTELRDMAWGQVQAYIADTYGNFFDEQLNTQVGDLLPTIIPTSEIDGWRNYSRDVEGILYGRAPYNAGITPQDLATSRSVLGDFPDITNYLENNPSHREENIIRPVVEALAYGLAAPESLAPYSVGNVSSDNPELDDGTIILSKAWADRMAPPVNAPSFQDADTLADTTSLELERMYLEARVHSIGAIARNGLLAPVARDAELAGLNRQLDQIQAIQGNGNLSLADAQAAVILAEVIESEALVHRIESHLRQERLMGSLIALHQEAAANDQSEAHE